MIHKYIYTVYINSPQSCICTAWNTQAHVNTNYHLHIGRQNDTFVGEIKKKKTASHLNTHALHHELLSITPSARLQSQASCFWWGEGERQRSRTLSQSTDLYVQETIDSESLLVLLF